MRISLYLTIKLVNGGQCSDIKDIIVPKEGFTQHIPRIGERVRIRTYIPTVRDVISECNISRKGSVTQWVTVYLDLDQEMTVDEAHEYMSHNWQYREE